MNIHEVLITNITWTDQRFGRKTKWHFFTWIITFKKKANKYRTTPFFKFNLFLYADVV